MKEIREITGMRGYASQSVIIFHFITIANIAGSFFLAPMMRAWNSGVDFFFVLSGFLLTIPFVAGGGFLGEDGSGRTTTKLRNYYLKRAFRILPVYYLSLFGILLFFSHGATLEQIVTSAFFLQSFSQSTFNSINGVSWTLVIEEIFYATLPVFGFFFCKDRWMYSLPVCIAISAVYRFVMYDLHNGQSDLNFYLWQYPSFIGHYAIGATIANLFVRRKSLLRFFSAKKLLSSALIGISVALILATQFYLGSKYSIFNDVHPLPGLLFAPEFGALIFFVLASSEGVVLKVIFSNPLAVALGRISYSVYSWHLPILITLYEMKLPLPEWIFGTYALTISIASLSYLCIEKPFLKLRNRFLKPEEVSKAQAKEGVVYVK